MRHSAFRCRWSLAAPVSSHTTTTEAKISMRAPEHTELLLMELGYDWDQIAAMKDSGAIL